MTARSRVQKLVEMAKAQYPKTTKETVATTLSYSIDETHSIEEIDKLLLEFEDNIISHGVPADIDYDAGTVSTFQETLKNINLFEFIDDDPTYLYNYEPKQTNENLNEDPQLLEPTEYENCIVGKNYCIQLDQTENENLNEDPQLDPSENENCIVEKNYCIQLDQTENENLNEDPQLDPSENENCIVEKNYCIQLDQTENENLNEDPQILTKKRTRKPDNWKRNIKKLAKNKGEEYVSESGSIVKSKVLKAPCVNCRYSCSSNISLEIREKIRTKFWEMGDKNRQREFVVRHAVQVSPKNIKKKLNSNRKLNNMAYYLESEEIGKVRVCKKMFEATLVVSDKMIRNCFNNLDSEGVLKPLQQGKHKNHQKISEELKRGVLDHIDSFPRIESHYLRAQTQREFIDGGLTIADMYRLYVIHQEQNEKEYVRKHVYYDLFNNKRNISFFVPKKDQCTTCESWKNISEEEKNLQRVKYDAHVEAKIQSREEKAKDVAKGKEGMVLVCCYDLQAVLQTPCGEVNMFYYKRKLGVYNFTVYETSSRHGFCYVWSEDKAKRGANEIASCLWKYLNNLNSITNLPIIFYSDNCTGQNKNKYIVCLYMLATMKLEIPSITHKFLVCGHSQNEGDAMHACIEKQKKKVLKSGPIYVPDQWIPVISMARKSEPYFVNQMTTDDMIDFKKLSGQIGSNFNVNTDNKKVLWGKIRTIEVRKESPFKIFYKEELSENSFKIIDVRKQKLRGRRPKTNPTDLSLNLAYSRPPGVTIKKKTDLLSLCEANVIPNIYQEFYRNLNTNLTADSDDE